MKIYNVYDIDNDGDNITYDDDIVFLLVKLLLLWTMKMILRSLRFVQWVQISYVRK
jgi:hypothetical protein